MFKPVSAKINLSEIEEKVLKSWQEDKVFEKSLEKRKNGKKFTFYDGPPFATGLPHYGHILAMTIKDAVTRFKTMQGFYVPRRLGWDCHGLPVEYEVEKELKISGKKQIEEMGVDKFCRACRDIVFRYTKEWEKTIDRMGRWADKENTYATLDLSYMESILWVFKSIWEKGLIYQDFKSMPYCPRCATPLSNFETNQGYKDNVSDPSVYVKFELLDELGTYFLAWTTTPWTLPGNAALALNSEIKYIQIKTEDGQNLILAKERLSVLSEKYEVVKEFKAQDLVGKKYKPLYEFIPQEKDKNAYIVTLADFVSTKDGTGIVHIAPAFGEDDLELGKRENLQVIKTVNERGEFVDQVTPWAGVFVKKADKEIIEDLKNRGLLYKEETIQHTYPFCWRCDTPLIYYAISTWFIKVSELRGQLVNNNEKIHWMPTHIKKGRFGKWLEEARDWAISRNRFWGAPIPLWQCKECKKYICIGSLKELEEKKIGEGKITDLHRPFIDEVKIKCECGGEAQRIPEVLDCWFESGSMPYAQDHYPFENKQEFEDNFPADFIAEGLDQTRGWFYTLHVLATILFNEPAFKNCIVNGIVLDPQGKKLSKRLRNYPEPEEIFAKHGADSLRFLLLSSPAALAEELRISDEAVAQVSRKLFLILLNIYNFFATYANIDKWQHATNSKQHENILDRWILSKLNGLILEVTKAADHYNLPKATNLISDFVHDDLSTWYVRRSRNRVGPTATDEDDKVLCYEILWEVLVSVCQILAPFAPFLVEEIYQNLSEEESVHLSNWPTVGVINETLHEEMELVRKICEMGNAERKKAGIKVRQPLAKLKVKSEKLKVVDENEKRQLEHLILDELNIKEIEWIDGKGELGVELDIVITPQLQAEGGARELIRQIQELRKSTGCALDERITIYAPSWPKDFEPYIKKQTLADKIIEGKELKIERHG